MCGICGIIAPEVGDQARTTIVEGMNTRLTHRGPDASGVVTLDNGVALGHRRLSILDLSPLGAQPMNSNSKRWTVVYNGEIYNFKKLRQELTKLGHSFRGESDTEVLCEALDCWGPEATLARLEGMFAIAAYNAENGKLFLARDRLGQKPLYYGYHHGHFVFTSVLRSLKELGTWPELEPNALALMLRYKGIPAPWSIYKGIKKLPAGSFVWVCTQSRAASESERYWAPFQHQHPKLQISEDEALQLVEQSLEKATAARMVSDVPLGAFLSGGIDSSLVVALMQKNSSKRVKTFTIGFENEGFNEAHDAKLVAEHLGTQHHELYITRNEVLDSVPKLAGSFDEPFGDPSALPTLLLSKLTRQHVTVALSGDGGDEAFGGYNRHFWLPRIHQKLSGIPLPIRLAAAFALDTQAARKLANFLSEKKLLKTRLPEDKINKIVKLLKGRSLEDQYRSLLSDWPSPSDMVRGADLDTIDEFRDIPPSLSSLERLCYADSLGYLPFDILVKVDRASMTHSLETRSPYLDHKLIELALQLPDEFKVCGTTGKLPLRKILSRHLPASLFERPKMGFAPPIGTWLKRELLSWVEDLLSPNNTSQQDLLDMTIVRNHWSAFLRGNSAETGPLWNALMFLSWLENREK